MPKNDSLLHLSIHNKIHRVNLKYLKMQSEEDEQRNERPPRACEWIAICSSRGRIVKHA